MAGALQRRDFRLLWGGQFVSDFGRQLTIFAFPTIAILGLHARAESVTAVTGSEYAVIPMFAMVAGVLIDRWHRRHTMILANVVRLLALASVPAAAALGRLTMLHLLLSATVVSLAGLFFDTAYQPFLASLVGRDEYPRGNARMTLSAQIAAALGNAFGGPLIAVLGAPLALVANLFTYATGTIALMRIRKTEIRTASEQRSFRREFREGCAIVTHDPLLRRLAVATAVFYLGGTLVDTVLPLYVYRELHQSPLAFGFMLAFAACGVLAGGVVSRGAVRWGPGPLLVVTALAVALGDALCTAAIAPLVAIIVGRMVVAAAAPAYEITVQTLATARVEDGALARMNAALRTLTNLTIPLGCFASGMLVTHLGCTTVIALGACTILTSALVLARIKGAGTTQTCSHSTTTICALPSAA